MKKVLICALFCVMASASYAQEPEPREEAARLLMKTDIMEFLSKERSAPQADVQYVTSLYGVVSSFKVTKISDCSLLDNKKDITCKIDFTYRKEMNPSSKEYQYRDDNVTFILAPEEHLKMPDAPHWFSAKWDVRKFADSMKK